MGIAQYKKPHHLCNMNKRKKIYITKVVNVSALSDKLGFSKNYLKRTNKNFPLWIIPEIDRLNEIIDDWIEDVIKIRTERKK